MIGGPPPKFHRTLGQPLKEGIRGFRGIQHGWELGKLKRLRGAHKSSSYLDDLALTAFEPPLTSPSVVWGRTRQFL
jgi:hypothetical protein